MSQTTINELENPLCKLALEDGTVVTGVAVGFRGETGGELCFNTSMTGYQEIFSDPSYHGQIMMMTYPHIGNYGTSDEDMEASRPMVSGVVVRSFSHRFSNQHRSVSLDDFMKSHKLVGISGVDTRALVLHIREKGVMNAVISSVDLDDDSLVAKAKNWPSMNGLELASRVSAKESYDFASGDGPRVAVYDFGVKQNILKSFKSKGCSVRVFNSETDLGTVLDWNPDGIFFSNGPGDPRAMPNTIATVKAAMETGIPLFGICLGHQLLALGAGLDVYKMFVGHRGANHPVQNLVSGKVEVSTQNHGFAVDKKSLSPEIGDLTHINLNDDTLEGIRFKSGPAFSVQYHPEASPGPHDSHYLFEEFMRDIKAHSGATSTNDVSEYMIYAAR